MILPYPKFMDTTAFTVNLYDGIDTNGAPLQVATYSGKCCFSESTRMKRDADGKLIDLNAQLIVGEDIAPGIKIIDGDVFINDTKYKIYQGKRLRNPDGSIHHVKLELI